MDRLVAAAALAAALAAIPAAAHAQGGLELRVSQEVYYYGDRLEFTVVAPGGAGGQAALTIADSAGGSSAPIPILLEGESTVSRAPFPFEAPVYPEGEYVLTLRHGGEEATARFMLQDGGRAVIPSLVRQVAAHWLAGEVSGASFAGAIRGLADAGMLEAPPAGGEPAVPRWLMPVTAWWLDGLVTDGEYAGALQYLIRAGVVVV